MGGVRKTGAIARPWHCDDTTDDESGGENSDVQKLAIARPKFCIEDDGVTDSDSTKSSTSPRTPTRANQYVVTDLVTDQSAFSDLLGEVLEVPTWTDQSAMPDSTHGQVAFPDLLGEASEVNFSVSNTSESLLDF